MTNVEANSPQKIYKNINNSSEQQTAQEYLKLSEDELFIAKVLYSETSTLCSFEEILAIGNVIQNRVGHPGFGKLRSPIDVVKQRAAFSSVLKHNSNWDRYSINLNQYTKYDAGVAKILLSSNMRLGGESWMKDVVYYHDKSISKPKSWDNKYWRAVLVKETQHFKFYKVVKAR